MIIFLLNKLITHFEKIIPRKKNENFLKIMKNILRFENIQKFHLIFKGGQFDPP